jgi:hypothetical protein
MAMLPKESLHKLILWLVRRAGMKQQSLASQGVFEKYGRKSRRELFLEEMEGVVPWLALSLPRIT